LFREEWFQEGVAMWQDDLLRQLVFSASPLDFVSSGRFDYAVCHNPGDDKACYGIGQALLFESFSEFRHGTPEGPGPLITPVYARQ
jgi:hypothetical protein